MKKPISFSEFISIAYPNYVISDYHRELIETLEKTVDCNKPVRIRYIRGRILGVTGIRNMYEAWLRSMFDDE